MAKKNPKKHTDASATARVLPDIEGIDTPMPPVSPPAEEAGPEAGPTPATRQKAVYDPSKPAGPRNKRDFPVPEGGIVGVPEEFDGNTCKPPGRKDFKDEADFLDFRANMREKQVVADRKQAETLRTLGPVKNRAVALKLAKLRSQTDVLIAQLESEGVDVKAALRAMEGTSEA